MAVGDLGTRLLCSYRQKRTLTVEGVVEQLFWQKSEEIAKDFTRFGKMKSPNYSLKTVKKNSKKSTQR